MEKKKCQAILLTPSNRYWAMRSPTAEIRCKFPSKPESNFCGVHAKLGNFIEEIVWKNEEPQEDIS